VISTLVDEVSARALTVTNGFGPLRDDARQIFSTYEPADCMELAQELYASDAHQVRCVATFLFGMLSSTKPEAFSIMREKVARDPDWRVQEILAMAFDNYCRDTGYERALPIIRDWLADPDPNVRRAVPEGLRIWTARDYFKAHPEVAVALLAPLRSDESVYVRKSVGNALRDISRRHPDLIEAEVAKWDATNRAVAQTYKLAIRHLQGA